MSEMSDRTFWIIVAAWTLVVIAIGVRTWIRIRREDRKQEQRYAMPVRVITGAEQRELEREQSDFNTRRGSRIRLSTPDEWATYEREVLTNEASPVRDNAYLERARKAESLGFLDPDDAA